jgi:cytochrome b6-f complex iron-sulfur subunit
MASPMGFFKAILGICETPLLDEGLWTVDGGQVNLRLGQARALSPAGGAVRLEGNGLPSSVLVVHADGGEYLAFQNRCTHGGRRIDPVEGKRELRCCSVGHSRFDYQGNKLSGSAKGPLTVYPVQKQGEELIVTLEAASA